MRTHSLRSGLQYAAGYAGSGVWLFLDPGGVVACSRWLSVVGDTTGTEISQFRTPAGVPAHCKIKSLSPFQGPFQGAEIFDLSIRWCRQRCSTTGYRRRPLRGQTPTFLRLDLPFVHNMKPEKWAERLQISHSCWRVSFRKAKPERRLRRLKCRNSRAGFNLPAFLLLKSGRLKPCPT
jgi:hypothetical protein